ncbi:MAG: glycosyltransferase family 2 protein [Acidobacteriota bacterium]
MSTPHQTPPSPTGTPSARNREPHVSVVVPMLNERSSIDACLDTIADQDLDAAYEVLVVDGGSRDGSRERVAERCSRDPRFRLLENPAGLVSSALNRAIAVARGNFLVRVDAHTLLSPDYVRTCLAVLAETGADNVGGPMRPVGSTAFGRAVAIAMVSRFGIGTAPFRFATRRREVDTVYLGAFPMNLFDRLGGFDEGLLRNQDYEMNYRICQAGGRIVVDPAIDCRYLTRPDGRSLWAQFSSYGFWKWRMLRRHPKSLKLRQLAPPAFVASLAGGGAGSLFGLLSSRPLLAWAALLPILLWSLTAALSSLWALRRHAPATVVRLPLVFAILHLAWGSGFLRSLLTPVPAGSPPVAPGPPRATPPETA